MKARRYGLFVAAPVGPEADTTAYRITFPDGYRPELLFLVHSEWRRLHVIEALQALRAKDANPPDLNVHVMTFDQAKEFLTTAVPAEWSPAAVAEKPNAVAKESPKDGDAVRSTRARVRFDDAQLLKDGFNALLDELKARGGTKSLSAQTKGRLQKTREFIVWLVQGTAAAAGKKWPGAERRQQRSPSVPLPKSN